MSIHLTIAQPQPHLPHIADRVYRTQPFPSQYWCKIHVCDYISSYFFIIHLIGRKSSVSIDTAGASIGAAGGGGPVTGEHVDVADGGGVATCGHVDVAGGDV